VSFKADGNDVEGGSLSYAPVNVLNWTVTIDDQINNSGTGCGGGQNGGVCVNWNVNATGAALSGSPFDWGFLVKFTEGTTPDKQGEGSFSMCGIIGYVGDREASGILLDGLLSRPPDPISQHDSASASRLSSRDASGPRRRSAPECGEVGYN
jgi:hypothetical protein